MTQEYRQLAKGLSVGIIMDGNGRWAKQRGLPRTAGHKKGAEVFRDMVHYCNELELASVTFYAFSTENWARPLEEVESIMRLFGNYLTMAYDYKKENNRLVFLGDRSRLSKGLQQKMDDLEEKTKNNTGTFLNIAINYGGRQEILHAAQVLAQRVKDGTLEPQQITEELFSDNLYTHGQKDPDFILRPSGEMRLSNFMLWQASYAEFISMNVLWPDFTRAHLDEAILEFCKRNRRFGGL
ncbi:MAG TPA: di-trans,poly-cis-decaprenylcistransferase [Candidatus Ruthenibacterium avium]|uniref:Isoprenyl transferase n=1 Tax=Candidatus Ruthenibacterium avium TaxID=2838751 RepID=A0A9D2M0U6_9FIRM|nr:di-trans,poly-cis-decaprenylcistransferase [Candidatus Ruthenibacterium avium]